MAVATNTLLDAGALVPVKAKIKDPQHVDEISAPRVSSPGTRRPPGSAALGG